MDSNESSLSNKQEVKSDLVELPREGSIVLYKIFGEAEFSFKAAHADSITDWSGFYTQYTPEHSMRYLTKKWSDGSSFACLISITLNLNAKDNSLKLLKIAHSWLGDPLIPGQIKARLIKLHLSSKYGINFGQVCQMPLLKRLGQLGILLQCVDSEEEEVVIPHDLLTEKHFNFKGLVTFERSNDGMLRTVRWKEYGGEKWMPVKGEEQFEPYLLLKTCKGIKKCLHQQ